MLNVWPGLSKLAPGEIFSGRHFQLLCLGKKNLRYLCWNSWKKLSHVENCSIFAHIQFTTGWNDLLSFCEIELFNWIYEINPCTSIMLSELNLNLGERSVRAGEAERTPNWTLAPIRAHKEPLRPGRWVESAGWVKEKGRRAEGFTSLNEDLLCSSVRESLTEIARPGQAWK